ncbi:alpha/beta fold hydrolase [Dyella telluris]|uniref:Alpha/beta hydrolase n=1 Tax=Dyella telluris TaxID=2763498 RepID=A0A7G8Q5S6_9GAMM|nr:alpha/beta hydrolase [Dyella telluris]QNK02134.1 alpha/beta hydrolase [Dyella telluris]
MRIAGLLSLLLCSLLSFPARSEALREGWQAVDGMQVFYREAGEPHAPTVVFLHGNPLSSIMYARVMETLASTRHVHVIAMDYPSFGYSDAPDHRTYAYTFDHLAQTVDAFLKARGISRYSLYMQDYGVPVGFRLMALHPDAIQTVMVQNGVIHLDGFPAAQDPHGELRQHWAHRNPAVDKRRADYVRSLGYPTFGHVDDEDHAGPDALMQMVAAEQRPGVIDARNDLWYDYGSNVRRYPQWQALLARLHVPVLVLWGNRDPFFTTPGAYAYQRTVPDAEVHVIDSTHFATLDAPDAVANLIGHFLDTHAPSMQ